MAFVPLFVQSHFSPRGVNAPADLARRARALGYATVGLCDVASAAGFLEFEDACRTQGIRPIFGCRLELDGFSLTGRSFPVDFLIETEQGYRNLMRLLNAAGAHGVGAARALRSAELRDRIQGLTLVIPPDGELFALLALRERSRTEQFIKGLVDLCGEALAFGLIAPREDFAPSTPEPAGEGSVESPGNTAAAPDLIRFALQLGRFVHVRCLAAPRIEYAEPGDAAAAIYLANPTGAPGRQYKPSADQHLLPTLLPEDEVLAQYSADFIDLPHEAGNLARRCTWRPGRMRRIYPTMDLERGFDPNSYLFDLALRGAAQRYGEITEWLKQRINKEIDDIRAHELAPYVLLNWQISQALDQRGVLRGVGRGRLVSSVVAYCLGITRLDPTIYRLAQRTLMLEGEQLPPVSVEVPRGAQPVVLAYLRETFGENHLAEIGRMQEWRRDQMIVELANWAGMTAEERRLVQRERTRVRSAGAAQRLGELAETSRARRWRDAAFLGDLVARLAPRPKAWQATGDRFVLASEPVEAILPLVPAQQVRPVTGIEEDALDRLGLARISFVPHHLLDILDHAFELARLQQSGLTFDNIPLDDRPAFELCARGDTAGIPPLESITLRCMLRRQGTVNMLRLLAAKNESANALRPPGSVEKPRELGDHLPDVVLSYQCAWLKAHYPLAFFGAVIGAALQRHESPVALVRAARRQGFSILAPDINLSDWLCTFHAGQIRLGLAAVKGFGQRAWENLRLVRAGGNFTTLDDFCERIDARLINLRTLRALAASGAMDGLDPDRNRARLDARLARLQKRARDRSAPEPSDANAPSAEHQPMLFEMEEFQEPETPAAEWENIEDWNAFDKEVRQTEALGFALNTDSVRAYKIADEHLRPRQVEQVVLRPGRALVRVAGLVCTTEPASGLFENSEDTLIDLEGIPVLFPAGLARHTEAALLPGAEVLVIGQVIKQNHLVVLAADGLWRLADLEDQATKVSALRLNLAGENRHTLKLLIALAREFPGNSALQLLNYPGGQGWTYRRLARLGVFFCSPFYQGLSKILPPEMVELFGPAGEPLLIKTTDTPNDEDPDADPDSESQPVTRNPQPDPTTSQTPPA